MTILAETTSIAIHSDGLKRYLVERLEQLGHKVTLAPIEAA